MSLISSVLDFFLNKLLHAFWGIFSKSKIIISLSGEAIEISAMADDGSIDHNHEGYSYEIRDGKLKRRGQHATFKSLLTIKDHSQIISIGHVTAQGRYCNGNYFLIYSVIDNDKQQSWSGNMVLRDTGLDKLKGCWMTVDNYNPSLFAFGTIKLERM